MTPPEQTSFVGKFDRLRREAEAFLRARPGSGTESPGDMLALVHELEVHHVELEMQNTVYGA